MIKKEFETSPGLFFRAARELRSSNSRCPVCIYLVLAVVLAVNFLYRDDPGMLMFGVPGWVPLAGVASFFLIAPEIQYVAIARSWRSSAWMSAAQQYEISEAGIRNYGGGFSAEISWKMIKKIKVSRKFVFFFTSNSCAQFIPRNLLSSAEIAHGSMEG
jgi:hypothetical protein